MHQIIEKEGKVMIQRRRFHVSDVINSTFFQVPKFLFTEEFKDLNSDARLLYAMLKDRHELSLKNRWLTDDGEVYLIYTREEMMRMLQVSKPTVIKAMETLKEHGLLEEVRQGLRKPNLIFMYMIEDEYFQFPSDSLDDKEKIEETNADERSTNKPLNSGEIPEVKNLYFKKSKNFTSGSKNSLPQEVKNLYPIYTDSNKTDISNTDNLSINQESDRNDRLIDKYKFYEHRIKENIQYYDLMQSYPYKHDEITELLRIILSVLISDERELVRVNGKYLPSQLVKERMLDLRYEHIQYVFDSLNNISHKIKNIRSYLITTLYNAPETMGNYYEAKVREAFGG